MCGALCWISVYCSSTARGPFTFTKPFHRQTCPQHSHTSKWVSNEWRRKKAGKKTLPDSTVCWFFPVTTVWRTTSTLNSHARDTLWWQSGFLTRERQILFHRGPNTGRQAGTTLTLPKIKLIASIYQDKLFSDWWNSFNTTPARGEYYSCFWPKDNILYFLLEFDCF